MYECYTGLAFDVDGTILDTEPTHRKAWCEVLGHYGLQCSVQAMVALNDSSTWRIVQVIIELNQADFDPHVLAHEKIRVVRSMLLDSVEPFPLVKVVKSWRGRRPVAIGTGSESAITEILLAHPGLRRYFDAVTIAGHVKHRKPTPDTLLLRAQCMGMQPTQYVVFEDADFGIQAVHTAGVGTMDVRLLRVKCYRFSRCSPIVFSALHCHLATPELC